MTETMHTRSRRASLGGLALQLAAFGGILALSFATRSQALQHLAWYVLGGVPIWFVALLVFRQRELAALEALDLEELRREKQATGGGEALFDQAGGGALGLRVAQARLDWMQRWLVPAFSLLSALYLGLMGLLLWRLLAASGLGLRTGGWPELTNVPIALVVLAIIMLGTFLYSRYASGMGRVREWQLLRGCGAFLLGNALATAAVLVCLGVWQYTKSATAEHALAFIIPGLMAVLAVETLINFVLDIYRPRAPGVEPRAAFDSRLLGLLAEPGGIASSIADAINYQFGFQVSQTWFYKLLERAFVPLAGAGALALWLLSSITVVQPYEHAIIERFGRQLNAGNPLGPGLHFKLPWPIDVARLYTTGQLQELHVGYQRYDAIPVVKRDARRPELLLWTDVTHYDLEHFDFLTCPSAAAADADEAPAPEAPAEGGAEGEAGTARQPVHLIRLDLVVQYRIRPDQLDRFTRTSADPHRTMLDVAWEQAGRYLASSTVEMLLSQDLERIGAQLRERIAAATRDYGLDVVYVGVTNVHPERTVAEAYRNVVKAEQEKVAAIREARVTENQKLSAVAGEAGRARSLAEAVERARQANEALSATGQVLAQADPAVLERLLERLAAHEALFRRHLEARARRERAVQRQALVEDEFALGLGRTFAEKHEAGLAVEQARAEEAAAAAALETALEPLRTEAREALGPRPELVVALVGQAEARVAQRLWEDVLRRDFTPERLGGRAAEVLAAALADRWAIELQAAGELTQAEHERAAYRAAPEVYKARRITEVLVAGLRDARKYFLGFDPGDRRVRVRFILEDQPVDIFELGGKRD